MPQKHSTPKTKQPKRKEAKEDALVRSIQTGFVTLAVIARLVNRTRAIKGKKGTLRDDVALIGIRALLLDWRADKIAYEKAYGRAKKGGARDEKK